MPDSGEGKTGKLPLGLPYLALSICIFILFRSRKLPSLIYLMRACPPPNSFFFLTIRILSHWVFRIFFQVSYFPSCFFYHFIFVWYFEISFLLDSLGQEILSRPLWTCIPITFFIPRMWVGMMWCVSFSRGRQRPFPWGLAGQRGQLEGALCSTSF